MMRVQSNGKLRRSEAEWQRILGQYRQSGLSVASLCRREGIAKSTFSKWQGRTRAARFERGPAPFVELSLPQATSSRSVAQTSPVSGELELALPGGITLRWRA